MEVDEDHYVSAGGEQLHVPAITPFIAHRDFGASMDDELHGIFFVGIEVGRFDQKALDFVAIGAGEPEGLEGRGEGTEIADYRSRG